MPSGTDFLEAIRAAYAEVHGHLGAFPVLWHTTWLVGVSYVVTSTALFEGCSSPIGMLLFLNDRLDYRYWFGPLLAGLAIGALLALVLRLSSRTVGGILAPAVFVTVSMVTSVALTAAPVDRAREQAIADHAFVGFFVAKCVMSRAFTILFGVPARSMPLIVTAKIRCRAPRDAPPIS